MSGDEHNRKFCEHLEEFGKLADEVREHHIKSVEMFGRIESMSQSVATLVQNTNYLKHLSVIAEQMTTVKSKLIDAATDKSVARSSTPNFAVAILMTFMFAVIFCVSAVFLVERVQEKNTSILIDAMKGRLEVGTQASPIPEKKTP